VGWRVLANRLTEQLVNAGALTSPRWTAAFRAVPRHRLVPVRYTYELGGHGWRAEPLDTADGLRLAYSNTALHTVPGGYSSTSMPSLMARMLETLDLEDSHRVLEIGTGPGYNAALLCHGLGDAAVSSVDVEPELSELARRRLSDLGYRPHLAVGDGRTGLADRAPFDRLIATCSVPRVPPAWVEQLREGGLALLDLRLTSHAGNLVLLRRTADGRAEGRFLRRPGAFMPLRAVPFAAAGWESQEPRSTPPELSARASPLALPRPWENTAFWFLLWLCTGQPASFGHLLDPRTHKPGDAFLVGTDGSWCEISAEVSGEVSGEVTLEVCEGGPTQLWRAVEDTWARWSALGEPAWDRFGVTVNGGEQSVWLDTPAGPHHWPLPPRSPRSL